jgi:hypothetical protein
VVRPTLDLDTSNLIDLEQDRPAAIHVRKLKASNDARFIELRLIAASASERQQDESSLSTFNEFQDWVHRLGFHDVPILRPLGISGVTYWDWCIWGDGDGPLGSLYESVGKALFPATWGGRELLRNKICDVLMIWSHIHYRGDAFVTSNTRHFLKPVRKRALQALGAGELLTPEEAVERYR